MTQNQGMRLDLTRSPRRLLLLVAASSNQAINLTMQCSNDSHFDPRAQILALNETQALEYAKNFIDQNCAESDAVFLSEVITAGENSLRVTYQHANGGSPIAQFVYGATQLHGSHTNPSCSEGFFWLMRAFNNGNPSAATVLAGAYMDGQHLPKCMQKAYKFASFAAERQHPAGMFVLANLLLGGGEIPEDQQRAINLLQVAAKGGFAPALKMLADNDIPLDSEVAFPARR